MKDIEYPESLRLKNSKVILNDPKLIPNMVPNSELSESKIRKGDSNEKTDNINCQFKGDSSDSNGQLNMNSNGEIKIHIESTESNIDSNIGSNGLPMKSSDSNGVFENTDSNWVIKN